MGLTLLTGGIRSGKSSLAIRWAGANGGPVTYIATAEAGDDEMRSRIERHRRERPESWATREEPIELASALAGVGSGSVVVDCITLWVSNLIHAGFSDDEIVKRSQGALDAAVASVADPYVITNEVGSGIIPDNALARRYEEILGRVNVMWSAAADDAFLTVAGRAVRLEPPV